MPVWILRSSGRIVWVGSEATDFGGSFSIVSANAPAASPKARPNILSLDMAELLARTLKGWCNASKKAERKTGVARERRSKVVLASASPIRLYYLLWPVLVNTKI